MKDPTLKNKNINIVHPIRMTEIEQPIVVISPRANAFATLICASLPWKSRSTAKFVKCVHAQTTFVEELADGMIMHPSVFQLPVSNS